MYTSGYVFASDRTWFKMPAYSASYMSKDIEDGDKIYLPASVLDSLMRRFSDRSLPNPILFELNNNNAGRTTHCGVLEFTSTSESAFLPHWMMENLMLNEGNDVRLRVRDLPKATEIKLKPVEYEFTTLPAPKYTLEHALRKFSALTVGDTILILHNTQSYHLIVESLQPKTTYPNAGCVVNTSLTVDFSEPVQKNAKDGKTVVEEKLEWDDSKEGIVEADSYHYYRFRYEKDQNKHIKIECKAIKGSIQPDFYISTTQPKPSMIDCMWKSSIKTGSTLVLNTSSISNTSNPSPSSSPTGSSPLINSLIQWFYLSVHAYKQQANYSLTISKVDPSPYAVTPLSSSPSMTSLSSSPPNSYIPSSSPLSSTASSSPGLYSTTGNSLVQTSSSATLLSAQSPPPDTTYCNNCRQYISKKQYTLHSIQCSRVNVWCDGCGAIIKKSEQSTHKHCPTCNIPLHQDEVAKHIDLVHSTVKCDCGQTMSVSQLDYHKTNDCVLRLVTCRYCSVSIPFNEMSDHEIYCGSKTIHCELCEAPVPRKKMNIHLAAVHMINPSARPGGAYGKDILPASTTQRTNKISSSTSSDDWPEKNQGVGSRGWTGKSISSFNPSTVNPRGGGGGTSSSIAPSIRPTNNNNLYGHPPSYHQNSSTLNEDDDAILQAVMEESRLSAEKEMQKVDLTSDTASNDRNNNSLPSLSANDRRNNENINVVANYPEGGSRISNNVYEEVEGVSNDDDDDNNNNPYDVGEDEDNDWGEGDDDLSRTTSAPVSIPHSDASRPPRRDPTLCPYCHTEWPDLEAMTQHMQVCEEMQE